MPMWLSWLFFSIEIFYRITDTFLTIIFIMYTVFQNWLFLFITF